VNRASGKSGFTLAEGREIYYRIADPRLPELLNLARGTATYGVTPFLLTPQLETAMAVRGSFLIISSSKRSGLR
jgi:hypothetical protein